jgi:hypothetical protein
MDIEGLIGRKTVTLGGSAVVIRELAWPDALELFQRVSARIADIAEFQAISPTDAIGNALLKSTDDIRWFLAKATDLTPEQIERLPASAATRLVAYALGLTANEELFAAGKDVAQHLQGMLGMNSPSPSTASSARATPTPGATPSGS